MNVSILLLSLVGAGVLGRGGGAVAVDVDGWRNDPVWYDGKAEKCVYEATRTIYGVERRFLATAYTNKQVMDPATTTKAEEGQGGVEVFKHHWSERVPTERYDYDFSTAVFVRTRDLEPFKLTVATQDDCGASFKQMWRERPGEHGLRWLESVYFPGAGLRQGRLEGDDHGLVDALSLTLRDFPFAAAGKRPVVAIGRSLVPSQKSTRRVPFEPRPHVLALAGKETLELPVGAVEAYRVELRDERDDVEATYWLAADGSAPWLHALVRYDGPDGVTYRLRSIERTAYWER